MWPTAARPPRRSPARPLAWRSGTAAPSASRPVSERWPAAPAARWTACPSAAPALCWSAWGSASRREPAFRSRSSRPAAEPRYRGRRSGGGTTSWSCPCALSSLVPRSAGAVLAVLLLHVGWWIDANEGQHASARCAVVGDLEERVAVREVVVLAALVPLRDPVQERQLHAQVGRSAPVGAVRPVLRAGLRPSDRVALRIPLLGVNPVEERIGSLPGRDHEAEAVEGRVGRCPTHPAGRVDQDAAVDADGAVVIAVRVEGVVDRPGIQEADQRRERLCGLGQHVDQGAVRLAGKCWAVV